MAITLIADIITQGRLGALLQQPIWNEFPTQGHVRLTGNLDSGIIGELGITWLICIIV